MKKVEEKNTKKQVQDNPNIQQISEVDALKNEVAKLKEMLSGLGYESQEQATQALKTKQIGNLKKIEFANLEKIARQDLAKIKSMVQNKKISQEQAKALAQQINQKKAQSMKSIDENFSQYSNEMLDKANGTILDSFTKKYPQFNDVPENSKIVEYLKNSTGIINPKDLKFVMEILSKNAAGAQNSPQEATQGINEMNSKDLEKLSSSIDKPSSDFSVKNKIFTREQIKNMTPEEFEKYEEVIFDQLAKGLIK